MKGGSLILSLFLISLLVISGCAQMAPRFETSKEKLSNQDISSATPELYKWLGPPALPYYVTPDYHTALKTTPPGKILKKYRGSRDEFDDMEPMFYIIINKDIHSTLLFEIDRYIDDIYTDNGYSTEIFYCDECTQEEIRNTLSSGYYKGLVGAILIGDIPVSWVDSLPPSTTAMPSSYRYQMFDIDLVDLDGDGIFEKDPTLPDNIYEVTPINIFIGWLKTSGCASSMEGPSGECGSWIPYDECVSNSDCTWNTDFSPVEWCEFTDYESTIGPCLGFSLAGYSNESEALRNYFNKNHEYRTEENINYDKNMVVIDEIVNGVGNWGLIDDPYITSDDPPTGMAESGIEAFSIFSDDFDYYYALDTTDASDIESYMNRMALFSTIHSHASPTMHGFTEEEQVLGGCVQPGENAGWEYYPICYKYFDYHDVINLGESSIFHFWHGCSSARFITLNNIANWFIFRQNGGLVTFGPVMTMYMMTEYNGLYGPLVEGKNFGETYLIYHEDVLLTASDLNGNIYPDYPFGFNILGDPTLKIPPFTSHFDCSKDPPHIACDTGEKWTLDETGQCACVSLIGINEKTMEKIKKDNSELVSSY